MTGKNKIWKTDPWIRATLVVALLALSGGSGIRCGGENLENQADIRQGLPTDRVYLEGLEAMVSEIMELRAASLEGDNEANPADITVVSPYGGGTVRVRGTWTDGTESRLDTGNVELELSAYFSQRAQEFSGTLEYAKANQLEGQVNQDNYTLDNKHSYLGELELSVVGQPVSIRADYQKSVFYETVEGVQAITTRRDGEFRENDIIWRFENAE